jgi:hypothetical protein
MSDKGANWKKKRQQKKKNLWPKSVCLFTLVKGLRVHVTRSEQWYL